MPKRYIQTLLKWDDNIYFKKCELSFTNKKKKKKIKCLRGLLKLFWNVIILTKCDLFLTKK